MKKKWVTTIQVIRSNIFSRNRPEILTKWCFQRIFMRMKAEILFSKEVVVIINSTSPCYHYLYQSLKPSSHQNWLPETPSQRKSHISPFQFLIQAKSIQDYQKIQLIAQPFTRKRQIIIILPKVMMIK